VHSTPYDSIPFRRQQPPVVSLTQQFYIAPAAADRGALLSLTFTNDKFIHAVTWSPVPPAHCHIGVLRSSFSRLLNFGPCLDCLCKQISNIWMRSYWRCIADTQLKNLFIGKRNIKKMLIRFFLKYIYSTSCIQNCY